MTKIAVYMCSFQRPNLILNSVNSVLDQTLKDFKLYILENSQGKPRPLVKEKLKNVVDPRVKIFYEDNFLFAGEAFYKISTELSDKDETYSTFFADDSLMHPQKLEVLSSFLDENPSAWLVSGKMSKEGISSFEGDFVSQANGSYKVNLIQPLMRRKIIDAVGKWVVVRNDTPPYPDGWFWQTVSDLGFSPIYGSRSLKIDFCLDTIFDATYNQGAKGKWGRVFKSIQNGNEEGQFYE